MSDPLTEARELLAAASPRPWRDEYEHSGSVRTAAGGRLCTMTADDGRAEAALIAAAPRLLAALCDEVERLREFVAAYDAEQTVCDEAAELMNLRDREAYRASGVDERWTAATLAVTTARTALAALKKAESP